MPRTKPADQRRLDLLDAAEAALLEHGVSGMTVDHVVTGAGVAKGTFYLYFRSKDELIAALQRRYSEAFSTQLADAIEEPDDWGAKLDGAVRACFEDYDHEQQLHDALFAHVTKTDHDDAVAVFESLVRTFHDLLDAGVNAGAYDIEDVEATALLFFNAIHGSYDAVWKDADGTEEQRLIRSTQTLFRRAVGLPDPT